MIELKEYSFPADDYFHLMLRSVLKLYMWVFAYAGAFLGFLWLPLGEVVIFIVSMILIGITLFLVAYVGVWWSVDSKENAAVLQKRKMTFDAGMCHYVCEDGTEVKLPLAQIFRVDVLQDYYLLYIMKFGYIPVPRDAFASEDDRPRFEAEVVRGKTRKSGFVKHVAIYLVITAMLAAAGFAMHHAPYSEEAEFPEASVTEER